MGLPPFGIFLSELLIVLAAASAHQWVVLTCALVGLLLAFIALARLAIETESGDRVARSPGERWPVLAFASVGGTVIAVVLLVLVPFVSTFSINSAVSVAIGMH
jgi:formate hydrogenlyase subunit 3/multisubunit Na+/H+ antiporter MnhD subunit